MTDSHARGDTSAAMLDETIGANLERAVERFGEREALISCAQGRRYTYAQLGAAVDELARALMAAGLATGDRIGIWSPNRVEWTLVQYATAKLGAILVNVNPAYRTSELEYVLRQSGCRMLVAAPAFKTSDYRGMVEEVRPSLPALERVVFLDSRDWDQLMAGAPQVPADELRAR
jgi:fatty-acyl-CoA synthase